MALDAVNAVFLEHIFLVKMLHFQTKRYGAHKALDSYWDKFLKNYDSFMEMGQGKYGRLKRDKLDFHQELLTDISVFDYLHHFQLFLKSLSALFRRDKDLLTIRDQMSGDAHQLEYLLSFV